MKPFIQHVFKLSGLLTVMMVLSTSVANATTYFSWGNNDPGVLANWWTVNNGTGTHPASFAGADVFTVQAGNTYTTTGTWTISGSVTVATGGTLVIASGNAVTIPTLTVTGTGLVTNNGNLTVNTNLSGTGGFTNAGTGYFSYGSATTISITTFTVTAAGNTVDYSRAGAQTVKTGTYVNLTVSGSGLKTTATVTVNGIMTMAGTASVSAVPTYGAASSLQYGGSAAQVPSIEFPASFTGTGGVISNNPLGVTMNAIKSVSKLTVNTGAVFNAGATNTWTLTVTGATSVSGTLNLTNSATKTFTGDITVNSGGTLSIDNTTAAIIAGNITVSSGGLMKHYVNYVSANVITMTGNLDLSGTYDYSTFLPAIFMNAPSGTRTINTGTTSVFYLLLRTATYNAAGPITVDGPFYAMWNVNAGAFHTNGQTIVANWGIVNAGGTFYIDGGSSVTINGANGGLLSASTVGGANAAVNMSSGTLTTPGINMGLAGSFTSTFTHSGGTINTTSLTIDNVSTYTCSNSPVLNLSTDLILTSGTFTTATAGVPDINITGNLSVASAGTFTNVAASNPTISVGASVTNAGILKPVGTVTYDVKGNWTNNGTSTATGGTVTFSGTGNQAIGGSSITTFGTLIINPSAGITVSATNSILALSDVTVSTGIFDLGTSTCNRTLSGGTFSLASGTKLRLGGNVGGAGASNFPNSFTANTLNANSTVEYYGSGGSANQTIYATPAYGYLILSTGGTKTAGAALTVNADLTINTTAIFAGSTFNHTVKGNWYNNVSTSAYTSSGTSTVTFNGSTGQTIGGSFGTTFTNLTVSDAGGLTLAQDQTVNSTLTLTAGNVTIGSNNLIFGSAANAVAGGPFSATKMIVADGSGEVRKNYSAVVGSFLFPIGDNTGTAEYSPITLNFTAGTSGGGPYAGVRVTNAKHPNNASTTDYLNRYWSVSTSGMISPSFDVTANYTAADIAGTEGNIAAAKFNVAIPWIKYGVLGSNTLTATAVTTTGSGIIFSGISNQVPIATISGGGVTFCVGGSASLSTVVTNNGTSTISYSWSPATGLSSTTVSNPTATPASTTTYTLTITDGNGITNSPLATTTITVTPANTAGAPSSTPTLCINTALTNITIATTGATGISNDGVSGANGLPAGVSAHWAANVITISGTPTASGPFSYSIALTGGCGAVNATGTITVTANNTAGAPSSTPTLCINTALTNITIATTGATGIANDNVTGANGLPAGVKAHWAANVITISGTPTASGPFSYSIALTGGCGAVNATGTITVTANNTAGAPSSTPTLCINTALTNITIATTGATGIANDNVTGANGLPAGVSAHWAANVITISGTPTASGPFSYSIALTGGCGAVNATGTITVTANNTAGAPSSTPTLCINTALTNITIATTGATGIANDNVTGANGLPAGVKAHWAANVITISGTPTASGPFSYSIALTGGCGAVNATGTITVTANNTAGAPSSTPTLCINTALTNITIATTGATGISNDGVSGANGLPAGVSAHWAANVITISGTPTASGPFSYSIALTGGCGAINATGTITVTANNTAGAPSSTPTLCINTALTNITIATTGATGISNDGVSGANGLPAGVSAHWAANVITISGTPTASGPFSYSIALTGGCGAINATGTITVTANNTAGAPSSTPTLCINTALTNITIATTGATGISNDGVSGANGLPAGVSAHWAANVITISGTPTASGPFSYSIALTGGCGAVNATGTITVTANNTAGAPSSTPTLCINTALTNITIATTGATGIANDNVTGANGLPAGVKAHWAANVITISGTPTASGPFSYSIALTGGCGAVNATGTITVTANNTAGAPSSTPTLCINTALTNITIATTGATGISNDGVSGANGLPAGVSAHWAANVITISGTPTASGPFSYSIALTGGCGAVNATGTITVTANNTAGAPSSTPTLCINTALTNITIATTGATGISNDGVSGANGLPAGVSAHWAANVITISGTPTASGPFSYSITLTGGCGAVNATGTITVNPASVGGTVSGSAAVCSGTNSGTLTLSGQTGSVVRWEYSTDGGTTWNTIVNTATTQSYTNLTLTTMYHAVMQSGVCASANSAGATITVTTPPSATISYATPFCFNSGTATVTRTGTAGGSYSSTAGLVINSVSGDINLTSSAPGQYTITYTIAASGGCSIYTANTVIIINPNTWTGTVSTDWNTAANWVGNAVPTTSCADVTILAGVPYQPTLGFGIATIQNIIINPGAILTISNATLQLSGTINNSGTFDVSNGAIELNGTGAQSIPASAFQNDALKDLIISNSSVAGVTLGGALDVYGSLTYTGTGMKLTTNDFLALKSNATNTAWIGDMTGNTITGKVSVERYISAHRAWRFLSVPTNTSQTIKQSWQENQAANNTSLVGWGTQISSNRATWSADGFDFYSTGGPSVKTYNSSTLAWDGITGTNIGIKSTEGYMTFIRGDRSANGASSTPTETVMRTKGDLYTGDQAPIIIPAGKFGVVGNPYASALDMRYITKAGVKNFFYLWDPNIGGTYGLGGYQTFSYNGSDYEVTPGMGSYGASGSVSNYIQSGLAFFVQATGSGGSVTLKEGAKTSGSAQVSIAVRPTQSPVSSPVGLSQSKLRTNLFGVNADNSTYIVDGVLNNYGNDYSNKVDDMDAIKSANTNENLSIKTDNLLLAIERRHTITQQDTIFLTIGHVKVQKYRFEFTASFNQPGLTGYLEDSYLNTRTLLNMNGTTTADFSIVNVPGAYAANRFRIVFTQASVLPLTITSVKAYQVNKNIAVEWKTENESNMKQYEVEKSVDGNHYTKANTVMAHNAQTNNYSWLDAQPVSGYNYYRIKSIDINGETKYSTVVKVFIGKAAQEITVYPNPVTNNTINLQLVNQPAGNYKVKLLNNMGQQVFEKDIEHAEGSSTELIPVMQSISKGIYQLQVIKPDGSITTNKLIF